MCWAGLFLCPLASRESRPGSPRGLCAGLGRQASKMARGLDGEALSSQEVTSLRVSPSLPRVILHFPEATQRPRERAVGGQRPFPSSASERRSGWPERSGLDPGL